MESDSRYRDLCRDFEITAERYRLFCIRGVFLVLVCVFGFAYLHGISQISHASGTAIQKAIEGVR